jgi:predicted aspartyl protease
MGVFVRRLFAVAALGLGLGCASASPQAAAPAEASIADARADEPVVTLPLRQLRTHHIVLPVVFDEGEPLDFILDTGASMSVITPRTREALGFGPDDGLTAQGQGAGGDLSDIRVLVLGKLSVGDREYKNHTVAVTDLSHLEEQLGAPIGGILGANFLARHVIELDFAGGLLKLHPKSAVDDGHVDTSSMAHIEFEHFVAGGLIRVEVNLDEAPPMPAVLDLGAGRSVVNWRGAKAAGLRRRSRKPSTTAEPLLGADNQPIETAGYLFETIRLGDYVVEKPELFVADLPIFQTLGVADSAAMVFGVDLFAGCTIVLDYGNRKLHVAPPVRAPG